MTERTELQDLIASVPGCATIGEGWEAHLAELRRDLRKKPYRDRLDLPESLRDICVAERDIRALTAVTTAKGTPDHTVAKRECWMFDRAVESLTGVLELDLPAGEVRNKNASDALVGALRAVLVEPIARETLEDLSGDDRAAGVVFMAGQVYRQTSLSEEHRVRRTRYVKQEAGASGVSWRTQLASELLEPTVATLEEYRDRQFSEAAFVGGVIGKLESKDHGAVVPEQGHHGDRFSVDAFPDAACALSAEEQFFLDEAKREAAAEEQAREDERRRDDEAAGLNARQLAIMDLSENEGLSYKEIAARLGTTAETAKTEATRARKKRKAKQPAAC